ncbi:cysteine hydrolase family protein [Chitinophaga sp. 30R24]|uniref:cysteine hydrolase family protein n=1 Tax=Chitinophaga sp. 30R24 TaxID=3248838 RepID=UPI003B908E3F
MGTTNQGTVLLVMDIQKKMMEFNPNPAPLLANIEKVVAGARAANITVVYVVLGFRPGYPDINPVNKNFAAIRESGGLFIAGSEGAEIHPAAAPLPEDIIVTKKRISAFAGSDLDIVLRSLKAEQLIITGYATSGIVLNTVREAADKDYSLIVLSDGCADSDQETHEFLMTKIFPRQAEIKTTAEWLATIG